MASPSVGEVVGTRVREARRRRDWTQQRLVDRLAELGHPMNRVTLAKIERPKSTRAQNVSLVDVLVLAAALDIPPTLLFLPLGEMDRVAITPTIEIHPDLAAKWIEGEGPLANTDRLAINPGEWRKAAIPLHLFQGLRPLRRDVVEAQMLLTQAERLGREGSTQRAKYVAALKRFAEHIVKMRGYGLRTVGLLTDEDYEAMAKFGLELERED